MTYPSWLAIDRKRVLRKIGARSDMTGKEALEVLREALEVAQSGMAMEKAANQGLKSAQCGEKVAMIIREIRRLEAELGVEENEDPEELEARSLDYLRGRGWRCERT